MTTYKSDRSQDVFDVVMRNYGSLDGMAQLLADNPSLVQNNGSIAQYGVAYNIDQNAVVTTEPSAITEPFKPRNTDPVQRPEYRSNVQQTVFDVALMQYGGLGGLPYLLTDNTELVQTSGGIQQFRTDHHVRTKVAADKRMKSLMLRLVPATEGAMKDQQYWMTQDNEAWETTSDEAWVTE